MVRSPVCPLGSHLNPCPDYWNFRLGWPMRRLFQDQAASLRIPPPTAALIGSDQTNGLNPRHRDLPRVVAVGKSVLFVF